MDRERVKLEIECARNLYNIRVKRLAKLKAVNAPQKIIDIDEELVKNIKNKLHTLESMLLAENIDIC